MSAEYDLMIAINDHMLKISVKGSSDGGWGIITLRRNVAIMAMIGATVLEPGVYFAMNSPGGLIGSTAAQAAQVISGWGFTVTPDMISQIEHVVELAPRQPMGNAESKDAKGRQLVDGRQGAARASAPFDFSGHDRSP